jgi:hypothetical protein
MLQLMNSINNIAKRILLDHIKIGVIRRESLQAISRKNFILKDCSSFINILKPYQIKIILSIDFKLLDEIRNKMFKNISEAGIDNIYYESLTNEILNIIIGNSTKILSIIGEPILFDIPRIYINSLQNNLRPNGWHVDFLTDKGNLRMYYLYNIDNETSSRQICEFNTIVPNIFEHQPA